MAEKQAIVTLKDHKQNFANDRSCRLINPAKSEIGHISQEFLTNILKSLVDKLKINLWINTTPVLEWFKGIKNKKQYQFFCFDVVELYPSITEKKYLQRP